MECNVLIKEEPLSGDLSLQELDETLNEDEELGSEWTNAIKLNINYAPLKSISGASGENSGEAGPLYRKYGREPEIPARVLEEPKISSLFTVKESDSCFGTEELTCSTPNCQSDNVEKLKDDDKNENDSQNANHRTVLKRKNAKPVKKRIRWRSSKVISCDICEFKTTHAGNLKRHIVSHSSEKPYACNICNYRTNLSNALKVHMKVHSSVKSFVCTYCDYRSSRAFDLTRHVRKHTGEKPYRCDICDYKASHNGHLKKHLMNHRGEKPYFCSVCSYKTNDSSSLKIHMRSHTGEKPHACTICDYRASSSYGIKSHLRFIHKPISNVIDFEFVSVISN